MSLRSPLHQEHVALDATFTTFAGWSMPVRYASDLQEHHAVRQRVGLFDLSHMAELEVHGPQAAEALDRALVGHLSAVAPGRARYTMLCAPDGGVLDDLVVYRRAEDEYLVVANAANRQSVARALKERAVGLHARIEDRTEEVALLAVQGPRAVELLTGLTASPLDALRSYAGTDAEVAGIEVFAARTGYTGEDGFELYCDAAAAAPLWARLREAGAAYDLAPCGLAARDTLRLEAGMPLYGHELGPERPPTAAGLGRVVAFDKPADFVGRAALEAAADAPLREHLVGLVAEGRRAPRAGYPVVGDDGEELGQVTSGALSPTLGVPIAMAYVPTSIAAGARVAVDVRGSRVPAEVVALPFYRRSR